MENKRTHTIVKNTALLYIRSIIIIILSIYSSRVLLDTLGVENFGVYNIVGGIVAMFLSLKSIFTASVQRFINYEKGAGNCEKVREIFSSSVYIHIAIALFFVFIAEIFGLYYIPRYLVLPDGMLSTALFVFHCSVVSTAVSIITIPYDAVIIANERMNFYAYLAICDVVLKLLIIFLLPLFPFEYLQSYVVLILLIAIIMRTLSMQYSKQFPECKLKKICDKGIVKQLTTFAGWNFLGCMVYSVVEEGTNMIINLFGGVTANAARGIAYQVRNAINSVSGNIVVASQPFITQKAATVERDVFWQYIFQQSRAIYYIIIITTFPIFLYANDILNFWLNNIPDGTLNFVRAILVYMVVMSFQKPLDLAFKAYNCLALYQIVDSIILFCTLPVIYIILQMGFPLYYAFLIFSLLRIVDYVVVLFVAKYQIGLKIRMYILNVFCPAVICFVLISIIGILFTLLPETQNFLILVLYILLLLVVSSCSIYLFILNSNERMVVNSILMKIFKI